ncbi:MAG: MFS transporter [Hyphomonadaceae bacterium]|nr:MFS transporter [Hyphomonadaceae bacterium]
MDVSSETIHSLLPLFLTGTLGVSVALVGLIDGVAESTAAITKVFSGYLSDRWGRRKPLILFGYGLGALTKPLFAIASGPLIVLGARFADRIGKGTRGAPRDALIADVTPPDIRGLWVAVIPAALATACVVFGVEEKRETVVRTDAAPPIRLEDLAQLRRPFWIVVAIGVVFTLARFSEAFLVLKANAEGLPLALAPLVLVAMNIVYALGAYPAGIFSDRVPPGLLLIWGLLALIAADLSLAYLPGLIGAFVGICLWGVHLAMSQGLLAKLIADHAPVSLRGSAYGVFNLATGLSLLFASLIAGLVWDLAGPAMTFLVGACFAALAGVLVVATQNAIVLPPDKQGDND